MSKIAMDPRAMHQSFLNGGVHLFHRGAEISIAADGSSVAVFTPNESQPDYMSPHRDPVEGIADCAAWIDREKGQ